MNLEEAREIAEGYQKGHPDYREAVEICIEDDYEVVAVDRVDDEVIE